MGVIYRAEQAALERGRWRWGQSAPPSRATLVVVWRFLVEARAASRLTHPNAVTIYAFGNMPAGSRT
jgi:hypothetical protein